MKKYSIRIGLFALVAFLTGTVSAQDQLHRFQGYNWFDNHISFEYSAAVGEGVRSEYRPMDQELMMPGGPMPETVRIEFERFGADGWQSTGAVIEVFHMSTFPGVDQPAAKVRDEVMELLELDAIALASRAAEMGLPSINQVTAAQVFAARAEPINFQTGSGYRFVTAAAQDVAPLTNARIYYNFQGITSDGEYFVAAVFPVAVPFLPDEVMDMDADEYETFAATYEPYIADIVSQTEALAADGFSPDLAALDAVIASLAVESPLTTFYPRESTIISYDGVTMQIDPTLASRVEVNLHPGVIEVEGEFTMFGPEPGYVGFDLLGYPFTDSLHSPRVEVYRTADFPGEDFVFGRELTELQAFLGERPELVSRAGDWEIKPLPLGLPLNAAQVIAAEPEYVTFGSGDGLRFLAYYAQDVSPVTSGGVFYAFAGLTADGEYLISARLPIRVPFLPAFEDIDHATFDYEGFVEGLDGYYADLLNGFAALSADEYTPSLMLLDALMASVTVE